MMILFCFSACVAVRVHFSVGRDEIPLGFVQLDCFGERRLSDLLVLRVCRVNWETVVQSRYVD